MHATPNLTPQLLLLKYTVEDTMNKQAHEEIVSLLLSCYTVKVELSVSCIVFVVDKICNGGTP